MTEALNRRLIEAVASRLIAAADELTALDRQIGDGDHGENMKLGCEAVLAQIEQLGHRPLPEALRAVGNILQMKVGGAAGPLYGTLFIVFGRGLAQDRGPGTQDAAGLAAALEGAIVAMQRLGHAETGCKTMLDVLVPVQRLLAEGGPDLPSRIDACAVAAAEATANLKATRGRAAFLGDRCIGHVDPGARSAQLMIAAVCSVLHDD